MTNKTLKAIVSAVNFAGFEFPGLKLPDGTYAIAVSQVVELFERSNKGFKFLKNNAQRDIKSLLGKDCTFKKVSTDLCKAKVNVLTLKQFEKLLHCLAAKGNQQACDILDIPNVNKPKKSKSKQGYIYLFEGYNALKLGYSTNVKQRLNTLCRWQNELELVIKIKGSLDKEKTYHTILHKTGNFYSDEWYPLYRKKEILNLLKQSITIER